MGLATSERSDSLSKGPPLFVSVEFGNEVFCPLATGNEDVGLNNVAIDGGAKTTMSAIDQDARSPFITQDHRDAMDLKRRSRRS